MTSTLCIGTDCSGIEAPIQALIQLGIPFEHVFCSDIDKYVIQSIKANYEPTIIFGNKDGPYPEGDITKRNIKDVPDIDIYVAGFPCQPFSAAGKREGFKDKRGNVFWSCLEVIKKKQPKFFILENVTGLLSHDKEKKKDKYGKTWKTIWGEIEKLKGYNVDWKVLNTRDYGIPQNRERVFIVGTKDKFEWPEKIPMKELKNYVDWNDDNYYIWKRKKPLDIRLTSFFIDIDFMYYTDFPFSHLYSPCVVVGRSSLWCVPQHRYANVKEYLGLQGFPADFKQTISNTQIKKQAGNSMSVNVLVEIFKELLPKCFTI